MSGQFGFQTTDPVPPLNLSAEDKVRLSAEDEEFDLPDEEESKDA